MLLSKMEITLNPKFREEMIEENKRNIAVYMNEAIDKILENHGK